MRSVPQYIHRATFHLYHELLHLKCTRFGFHHPLEDPSAWLALGLLVFAFRLDPLQQLCGGFVVGVLGDELPAEGLGEDGLGQLVHVGLGFLVALLDVVGDLEEGFDAADDFVLFI